MYTDLKIVDDMKIRRPGWARHVVRMADGRIQKRFLMGNFIIQGQKEIHEDDGRTSSGGTHQRS